MSQIKNGKCPKCNSENVIPIVYGYIDGSPEVMRQIENQEIDVGGCLVGGDSPKWKCRNCENQFGNVNNMED